MPRHALPLLALLLAIPCSAHAQKEFADCGSTALMPLKLELEPDPAEVCARANLLAHSLPLGARCVGRAPHQHAQQQCGKAMRGRQLWPVADHLWRLSQGSGMASAVVDSDWPLNKYTSNQNVAEPQGTRCCAGEPTAGVHRHDGCP